MTKEDFYDGAEDRILAIYPQERFHHNAYIVGGRKGLTALRNALNEVLDGGNEPILSNQVGMVLAHPGDQETNGTFVILDEDFSSEEDDETGRTHAEHPVPYFDPKCVEAYSSSAVSLRPSEGHVMAAGIKSHIVSKAYELLGGDEEIEN